MTTLLLIVHLFVTLALIGVVLIQRSEGGGLGIGTSQGMGAFMTGKGTANLLTRTTAVLAALFFALSLTLALLNRGTAGVGRSILDVPAAQNAPISRTGQPAIPGAAPQPTPATPPSSSAPVPTAPVPATPVPASPAPAAPASSPHQP